MPGQRVLIAAGFVLRPILPDGRGALRYGGSGLDPGADRRQGPERRVATRPEGGEEKGGAAQDQRTRLYGGSTIFAPSTHFTTSSNERLPEQSRKEIRVS